MSNAVGSRPWPPSFQPLTDPRKPSFIPFHSKTFGPPGYASEMNPGTGMDLWCALITSQDWLVRSDAARAVLASQSGDQVVQRVTLHVCGATAVRTRRRNTEDSVHCPRICERQRLSSLLPRFPAVPVIGVMALLAPVVPSTFSPAAGPIPRELIHGLPGAAAHNSIRGLHARLCFTQIQSGRDARECC